MNTQQIWLRRTIVGISVSDSEDLLSHGYGREHLREVLLRLARPLLRAGADLAYGGHLRREGSFTRDLIQLISDEQREGNDDQRPWIGRLYNHSPWPYNLEITADHEANFIDACRFVRITQEIAGIPEDGRIEDPASESKGVREHVRFNTALVCSHVRKAMSAGLTLHDPRGRKEPIPPVSCRVLVAGKTSGYSGIIPGLYEELLYCLEAKQPVYVLGAFGGAAGKIAAFLTGRIDREEAGLELDALREMNPALEALESGFEKFPLPPRALRPKEGLERLSKLLETAKTDVPEALGNGLTEAENTRLFETSDSAEAADLVLRGLLSRAT